MLYLNTTGKKPPNKPLLSEQEHLQNPSAQQSVGQEESDNYLVGELAQAGRHRIIEFTKIYPVRIISRTLETGCSSTHFIAFIIGGGPDE